MTDYVMRVTIFAPQAKIADANQLALCLGQSAADAETFGTAGWKDGAENLYAVASTLARASFASDATAPLAAPGFAPDADLAAAGRAQAALVIHDPDTPVQVSPDRILAVIHNSAGTALTLAGVTQIATPHAG